ncbi:histidine kinase [Paenibacillus sp. 1_12]|uniref:histidine kinase n=1 Tax=Paenibacillus sp. 1_12 TaxID=1566278 RepID=UPI0035281BC6
MLSSYTIFLCIRTSQQKIAQYGALKSQINPHFLANALVIKRVYSILLSFIGTCVGKCYMYIDFVQGIFF